MGRMTPWIPPGGGCEGCDPAGEVQRLRSVAGNTWSRLRQVTSGDQSLPTLLKLFAMILLPLQSQIGVHGSLPIQIDPSRGSSRTLRRQRLRHILRSPCPATFLGGTICLMLCPSEASSGRSYRGHRPCVSPHPIFYAAPPGFVGRRMSQDARCDQRSLTLLGGAKGADRRDPLRGNRRS
jgi:hypothetical protein